MIEVIKLRDVAPGYSCFYWKSWKIAWFEGCPTAVEEGQTGRAKGEIGLDILNNK